MPNRYRTPVIFLMLLLSVPAVGHSPPKGAAIYFLNLKDGAVVTSPVQVRFGISGFGITPAGTTGKVRHTAGHFHLLVDAESLPDMDAPIPRDKNHLHFDGGERETLLELLPGRHTLQLLLGDEEHEPQEPPLMSERITITVR